MTSISGDSCVGDVDNRAGDIAAVDVRGARPAAVMNHDHDRLDALRHQRGGRLVSGVHFGSERQPLYEDCADDRRRALAAPGR